MSRPAEIVRIFVPSFRLIRPTKADAFHYWLRDGDPLPEFGWCKLRSDGGFLLSPCSGGVYFHIPLNRLEPVTGAAQEALSVLYAAAAVLRLGNKDNEVDARAICRERLAAHILAAKDVYAR